MVFVTFASLYSFEPDEVPNIQIPHLDKAVHFTFYFVAAVLGLLCFGDLLKKGGKDKKRLMFFMGIALFVFGMVIEVLQHTFTVHRTGDLFDVMANGFGVLAGVLFIAFAISSKKGLN